jgi:transcriptional regulator with XRE-family HTH domain
MSTAFAQRLRRLRKEKKLTMDALAHAAGISKSYVWELESRPAQRPSANVLSELAKALGVTLQDLLGEPPPVEASPEDLTFFRDYVGMSAADKERYKQMMELFKKPS